MEEEAFVENPIPIEERLQSFPSKIKSTKKAITNKKKGKKKMADEVKKTRVRKSFTEKVIEMFDKRSHLLTAAKYTTFKKRLINVTERWEKLVEDQKAATKLAKKRSKNLASYTVQELMREIESRSNHQF